LHVLPSSSQSLTGNQTQAQRLQFGRQVLALAFDLLRERGVAFDPELLIDDDWRSEIQPALALMPEMSQTRKMDAVPKGVYVADTVLLPQRVTLAGDTFILCRYFAAEDENTSINISGYHSLFIYVISDPRINAAMVRSSRRGVSPMRLNIDVKAPCVLVGIPPDFIGSTHVQGRSGVPGRGMGRVAGSLMPDSKIGPSGIPHLLDPDFEAFRLESDPTLGWYSERANNSSDARMMLSPDNRVKIQGQYSLRIESRKKSEGPLFLEQVLRVPPAGGVTRTFDLSVQTHGETNGRLTLNAYTLDHGNVARRIAQRDFKLHRAWKTATFRLKVPEAYDRVGLRIYPPRDGAQVWLDDVRLTATIKVPR
jgi:hypothetical protein